MTLELVAVSLRLGGECAWPARASWTDGPPFPDAANAAFRLVR